MSEVDLTAKHHTGLFHGSTCSPSGSIISYQAIHSVYLHSGGLCAPTGAVRPVAESLRVISQRRPSAYSVPASTLFAILQRLILSGGKKVHYTASGTRSCFIVL